MHRTVSELGIQDNVLIGFLQVSSIYEDKACMDICPGLDGKPEMAVEGLGIAAADLEGKDSSRFREAE